MLTKWMQNTYVGQLVVVVLDRRDRSQFVSHPVPPYLLFAENKMQGNCILWILNPRFVVVAVEQLSLEMF